MKQLPKTVLLIALAALMAFAASPTDAQHSGHRIKDLATVQGVRKNQLMGYGLVVGLDGTGDQTSQAPFTVQSFRNMLNQLGVRVPDNVQIQLDNVAAVMVTADLPPFSRPGQTIDITVSSIANADSLRGGNLIMTPLRAADGQVYAMAQGNLVVGGFGAEGRDGSRVTVNVPSSGRIPNGATVEREPPSGFGMGDTLTLNLHSPDFTTAMRLSERINDALGPDTARALDAMAVEVNAPANVSDRVGFVSFLENLEFVPGQAAARVIVNSRTGTVVIGSNVRVSAAAVTHGSLTVTIRERFAVDQPQPLAAGETVITPESDVEIEQELNPMFLFDPGTTLDEIVRAVNEVGAAPGDLVAILEALKQAGALRAEFIVI